MAAINEVAIMEGEFSRAWRKVKASPKKLKSLVVEEASKAKKLGQEDPRKILHSLKVGLAISIVSLLYYFEPLFEGFGVAAMWAVLTVVVVFEFSVGATLGKGVNRGIATCLGGALGFGSHRLAVFSGETFEPVLLGSFVFLIAAVVTYARFLPRLKARYDYGLLIFILTFCLISVSGYRDDEVLDMAHRRLSTILIGGSVSVIICVLICPVWAGDDLHNLVSNNIELLGIFLEGFGGQYFKETESRQPEDSKSSLLAYKSVLNAKITEESLANFAKWEPRHGQIRYRHPWGQYLKIGALTRQCAYNIEALNVYLNSEVQAPMAIREKIRESCMNMSSETSKALYELSSTIKTMTRSSTVLSHIENAKTASEDLKSLLPTELWRDADFLRVVPAATVASLLIDVVACTEKIFEEVHELASLARFRNPNAVNSEPRALARQETSRPCPPIDSAVHHTMTVE